ncbi:hypothetical protein DV515_00015844 [Chloebia gouldiae]|uniref:Uncharacterized protein n=1 Tax=Chloebia gouldiae TaxID=44316 RepID=A0A3L8RUD1_CHLGU|nr:hypothetical protein DV515_00015844 [Chloebia gouldiae]
MEISQEKRHCWSENYGDITEQGALQVQENHGDITGMATSEPQGHHRGRGIDSLRTMEISQDKGHCRSRRTMGISQEWQHQNHRDITGMGTSRVWEHHGKAGALQVWEKHGDITGMGISWESRRTAGLGTSEGHHSNEGIKDLGAVWETGVHCEFRNIMGVSWGCHRQAGPCGSGDSMGMETLWVWEHHGSIAGMGIMGLGTLRKQHGSIVSLGAPREREQGGMGPRATSPERISQWHDQSSRYSTELRDFKNQVLGMLEAAEKEREAMRAEAESAAVRVERLEREVDYLETQNPAPPCVEVDETLMDKQVATAKQRKNEKYTKLTGEALPWLPAGIVLSEGYPDPQSRCPASMDWGIVSQQSISDVSGTSSCIPLAWELQPSPRLEPCASPKPLGQGWGEGGSLMDAQGDFSMPPGMHLNPFSAFPRQLPDDQGGTG